MKRSVETSPPWQSHRQGPACKGGDDDPAPACLSRRFALGTCRGGEAIRVFPKFVVKPTDRDVRESHLPHPNQMSLPIECKLCAALSTYSHARARATRLRKKRPWLTSSRRERGPAASPLALVSCLLVAGESCPTRSRG